MERRFGRLQHFVSLAAVVGVGGLAAACSQGDTPVPPGGNDPIVTSTHAPPPISGGTMIVSKSRPNTAIVADTDRDQIWVVDLESQKPVGHVNLKDNDEPGRLVEDAHGNVHVALRKGGALATINIATLAVTRREVCAAPRGVAYDDKKDVVHVACMNGELVTFPASGGDATRTLHLERDIRDVIVKGDDLVVTKFRSAEIFRVLADGTVKDQKTHRPPTAKSTKMRQMGHAEQFSADQAWRTIGLPNGSVAMLHQRALDTSIVIRESGGDSYGGGGDTPGCDPTIVHSTVTIFDGDQLTTSPSSAPAIPNTLLPVDLAAHVAADGEMELSFVAAGDNRVVTITEHALALAASDDTDCDDGDDGQPVEGEPVALAYWGDKIVVQTRDPIAVQVLDSSRKVISLPGGSTKDTGHDMFHRNDGGTVRVACASCHGEGRDDGHVWNFNFGPRRTQNIANDVLTTAPFHWDGKMKDLGMIMHEVFEKRMGGRAVGKAHTDAFAQWIGKLPPMANPIVGEADSIARGEELFRGKAACNQCHTGSKFTNNQNKVVGTGRGQAEAFQVPSLVGVALRAPYMHDGCAADLTARFKNDPACTGGDQHGNVSQLSDAEVADLVAYLETL